MSHRILLADDHELFSSGIQSLFLRESDLEVVARVEDGREAGRVARELRPDLVLMDLAMPVLNGIEATRQITTELDGVRVLVLSMHSEARFVEAALEAGASGYLLKSAAFEELVRAIREVLAGRTYLSTAIAATVVEVLRRRAPTAESAFSVLTGREREVLQLMAEGHSTKAIASLLYLSPKTVHTHRERIRAKLGIDGVAGLIRYAIQEGLTSSDLDPGS